MGRLNNGPNGGFSGKAGSYIGYNWKGGSYIRGIPRLNKDRKPTPGQLAARAKFAFLNTLLKKFSGIIAITFRNYSPKMTGLMAAYSCNAKNVIGEYPDFQIDFPNFMISHGELQGARDATAIGEEGCTVTYHWNPAYERKKSSAADTSLLFAILPDTQVTYANFDNNRGQSTGKLLLPEASRGKVAELYLAFLSFDRLRSSESQYMGQIVIR